MDFHGLLTEGLSVQIKNQNMGAVVISHTRGGGAVISPNCSIFGVSSYLFICLTESTFDSDEGYCYICCWTDVDLTGSRKVLITVLWTNRRGIKHQKLQLSRFYVVSWEVWWSMYISFRLVLESYTLWCYFHLFISLMFIIQGMLTKLVGLVLI